MISKMHLALNDLKEDLSKTPLLIGWLIIGPIVAFYLDGWIGLVFGLINILLLGIYEIIINSLTPIPPDRDEIKKPVLELIFVLVLISLIFIIQLFDFDVWMVQPIHGVIKEIFRSVGFAVYNITVLPDWLKQDVYLAFSSTIKQLIPVIFLFTILGYNHKNMGLVNSFWKLTGMLFGITVIFGFLTGLLPGDNIFHAFTIFFVGIFINALPEELIFRGMLLPRIEYLFQNPINALVVSAIIFNMLHIPIQIANGNPVWMAILRTLSIGYPSGLIWGYLYLRTRSILPGVIWHGANGILGMIFMSH